ncbi:hypothetical protein [Paenisporosarcina sp. OV554]|uniref:hypothetical protein n=1 Tax=Paenisporosarcina sp. OV554 TaxID=2135694 RepID=UPI000D3799C4|nr:hypothetical protein [Paenisporosarcina sp. OV554]PUB08213.1 hypothetical protein C8K15_1404 [Paenisporosarcina sp. OV554]
MKIFIKLSLFLIIFITLSIVSFMVIFSLGMKSGALVAVLFIFLCFVIFCFSIFGVVKGNLNFIKLRNRTQVIGLMIFSICLTLFIGLAAFVNATIEHGLEKSNLGLEAKTRFLASSVFQAPTQKNLLKEEKSGITYLFTSGNEENIEKFDLLIKEETASFDTLFGNVDTDQLQIEVHNGSASLSSTLEDVGGYYNAINQTLHLRSNDDNWENVLLHEYTHYRIDQFSEKQNLPLSRIPLWFQEGVSELLGHTESYGIDLESVEVIDFHLLDSNNTFYQSRNENYDAYIQSFLAVQFLVNDHGMKIIPELMLSDTINEFYQNLEAVTRKNSAEFQETFISDLIEDREKVDEQFILAFEAINTKRYEQAEVILKEIKENGLKYDIEMADEHLKTIYMDQGLYEKAISLIEIKISRDDNGFRTNDLLALSESYLLVGNSKKALVSIETARDEMSAEHFFAQRIDKFVEAYQKINSDKSLAGYKMLFEEELFINKMVQKDLNEKLLLDYPGEF